MTISLCQIDIKLASTNLKQIVPQTFQTRALADLSLRIPNTYPVKPSEPAEEKRYFSLAFFFKVAKSKVALMALI